jgi:hypothetical protein
VSDCIARFREFIDAGFKNKAATKTPGIGWLARWFRGSIYRTEPLELGLQSAFNPGSRQEFYGLRGPRRVAVTTTVGSELKLISNYNRGGNEMYLSSQLDVWHALVSLPEDSFRRLYQSSKLIDTVPGVRQPHLCSSNTLPTRDVTAGMAD